MASKTTDYYTYRITWSEEDQQYVGLCSEFPSLSWLETSPENALLGIRKVVDKCLKDMKRNGETPPSPFSHRQYSGKLIIRIPPEVHRSLSIQAADHGISLNRLIASKLQT